MKNENKSSKQNVNIDSSADSAISSTADSSLYLNQDMLAYHEMADQTSVRSSLVAQVQSQIDQLTEMSARRRFLLKEIAGLIDKD